MKELGMQVYVGEHVHSVINRIANCMHMVTIE